MTTDAAETLRCLFEAWNRGDLGAGFEALDEFVVWDGRNLAVPELQRVYQGRAGVREFWQQWLPPWKKVTVDLRWIEGSGERARAWVQQIHIGHESGLEVRMDYGWDVVFRDGKIIHVSFFTDEQRHESRV